MSFSELPMKRLCGWPKMRSKAIRTNALKSQLTVTLAAILQVNSQVSEILRFKPKTATPQLCSNISSKVERKLVFEGMTFEARV
jgi:hypothetical protein